MGEVTSTWNVSVRSVDVGEDWNVSVRRTSMDSPIASVDSVAKANIGALHGVSSTSIMAIDGVRLKDVRWQVTITAP